MGLLELIKEVRALPATARAAATEVAVACGIDAYPRLHAVVQKGESGAWELVAVSIDPALLPEPGPGQFCLTGQLGP